MAGSCSHKTPFELHCSSCWNALVADRDEWKKRHDELSDTIVQFGIDNGNTASALLLFRHRAERAEALLERVARDIKCGECGGNGRITVRDQMVPSVPCVCSGGWGRGAHKVLADIATHISAREMDRRR